MPIFVADDSADVWANPELFQLDADRRPTVVAGVPPDYFAPTGQLWGNPLYDWEAHASGRLRLVGRALPARRWSWSTWCALDHFRGFEAAWEVPAGSRRRPSDGAWVNGPGGRCSTRCDARWASLPLSPRTWA